MITILSVSQTPLIFAPAPLPAKKPALIQRQIAQVGNVMVEFVGAADTLPTQADVNAFLAVQAVRASTQTRLDDINLDLSSMSLAGQTLADLRLMTKQEFRTFWGTLTVGQKDNMLMFLMMAALHRLL